MKHKAEAHNHNGIDWKTLDHCTKYLQEHDNEYAHVFNTEMREIMGKLMLEILDVNAFIGMETNSWEIIWNVAWIGPDE